MECCEGLSDISFVYLSVQVLIGEALTRTPLDKVVDTARYTDHVCLVSLTSE